MILNGRLFFANAVFSHHPSTKKNQRVIYFIEAGWQQD